MRKWLKREQRARPSRSLAQLDLSDSFEEFVRPLIGHLPPGFRLAKLREPLLLAAAVWNAVIAAKGDLGGAVAQVTEMMAELQQQPVSPKIPIVLEVLTARKSTSFGDDDRVIADLEVRRQGADVRVVAAGMRAARRVPV
jgi:hypothetical protein